MTPEKTIVSPKPRNTANEAFEDLDTHKLEKDQIGWVEKTYEGWVACVKLK